MSDNPQKKERPAVAPPVILPEGQGQPISPRAQWQCPRCGSTDLASTYLIDYSDKFGRVYLAPKGLTLRRLAWLLRPFKVLTRVDADTCRNCGMVILEVNTADLEEAEKRFGRR